MSAAIVRKALELSEDTPGPLEKAVKSSAKRKLKALEKSKKKKLSPDQLVRRNLKILKALQFASNNKKKYGKAPSEIPGPSSSSASVSNSSSKKKKNKSKKNNQEKSAFTEEDFEKFEKEYFVTD